MTLLHLGCDGDIRPGFDNLDQSIDGWRFESGLPYPDACVDGITISHALMYVQPTDWPAACLEFFRVLRRGGVVRITEDDTESPESGRFGVVYPGARCATGPAMAGMFLRESGFTVKICSATETLFHDGSLLIAHRENRKPKFVFYIEGQK